ncbi:MAG: YkgJ family cysteine cluster protein [Desulfomonilaceae bacterium]
MKQDTGWDPRKSLNMDDRMSRNDGFKFYCGPGLPCFTECCRKLELNLTPYDVLRLCKRLNQAPADFLEDYTAIKSGARHGFPEVFLKMGLDGERLCPFVSSEGCKVYEDRPGACRIYPLGRASSKNRFTNLNEEFFFVVREPHCRGFEQNRNWRIEEWLSDQNVEQYNKFNDQLMELYILGFRKAPTQFSTQQLQMFIMACYNIPKFREFIFKSSFLTKFELSLDEIELIRENDSFLLEFSFKWLKFAFFGIPFFRLNSKD